MTVPTKKEKSQPTIDDVRSRAILGGASHEQVEWAGLAGPDFVVMGIQELAEARKPKSQYVREKSSFFGAWEKGSVRPKDLGEGLWR